MVVYGDSHALMWIPAFEAIAKAAHWKLVVLGKWACPAIRSSVGYHYATGPNASCAAWHAWATRWIDRVKPSLLVVSQADFYYAPMPRGSAPVPFTANAWKDGLDALFTSFTVPSMRVALLGTTPILAQVAPVCLSAHQDDVQACSTSVQSALPSLSTVDRSAAAADQVQYIDTTPWFCSDTCTAIVGGNPVYDISGQHISGFWADYLQNVLAQALGLVHVGAAHST